VHVDQHIGQLDAGAPLPFGGSMQVGGGDQTSADQNFV
jgi:hypothetical protein